MSAARHSRDLTRIGRNLSTAWRVERIVARQQLQQLRRQSAFMALAALVAVMGLVMLNVAGFHALKTLMAPYGAALTIAGADFVLALGLLGLASRPPSSDMDAVTEMRDLAVSELEQDLESAAAEVQTISRDLKRMARDPLGTALPVVIGPLVSMLIKSALSGLSDRSETAAGSDAPIDPGKSDKSAKE